MLAFTACGETEHSADELKRITYLSDATGEEREYFVYLPEGYHTNTNHKWPVILFLHGNGERGNGREELDFVITHGPLYETWVQKRKLPFVIISPQLPMYGMDEFADYIQERQFTDIPERQMVGVPSRPDDFPTSFPMNGKESVLSENLPPQGPPNGWYRLEQDLLTILDQALSEFRTDPKRIHLSGISYGGFGVWFMGAKHPEKFATLSPVVGFGHPDLAGPIAESQIPVWCFAGGRDSVVPQQYFYPALNKLEELDHKNVKFTIHADMGHDAWTRIYAGEDIYNWMQKHQK